MLSSRSVAVIEGALAGIRMAAKAGESRGALRNIAAFAGRAYMRFDCRRGFANEKTETVRDKAMISGRGNSKNNCQVSCSPAVREARPTLWPQETFNDPNKARQSDRSIGGSDLQHVWSSTKFLSHT